MAARRWTFMLYAVLLMQALAVSVTAQNQTTCPDGQASDADGGCAPTDPAPRPDLVAAAIDIDRHDLREGDSVLLWTEVRNDGAAQASFQVALLLDGAVLGRPSGDLAPGAHLRLEWSWQATAGVHTFEVKVDPDNVLEESVETNNALSLGFDVAGRASEPSDTWTECRDGRLWEVTVHTDGNRTEQDVGPCDSASPPPPPPGSEPWPVNEWCDANGQRQVEYEYPDGRREVRPEGPCGPDGGHDGKYGEPPQPCDPAGPCDPHEPYPEYQDPYGCGQGTWWDHYLARCVSKAEWDLQDGFNRCTLEAHQSVAQDQRQRDIEAREAREERRLREQEAMRLEQEGRWDEAGRIWDELRHLDWEDQRRFHEVERRIAGAVDACIDPFAAEARANGWDDLAKEFEMQRFTPGPMPAAMPGPGGPCGAGPVDGPGGDASGYGGAYDDRSRSAYPSDGPTGPHPGDGARLQQVDGMDCGPGPGGPGGPDFGLPPEALQAMEEARAWCEEQHWAIEERMFAAQDYEAARAMEDEMREVERRCRERMEAVFREHDRGYEDGMDRHFGSFSMTETGTGIDVRGANTWFIGLPDQMRMTDFTCQGVSTIESVHPYFDIEDVRPIAEYKLGFFAGAERPFLVVHDDPLCTVGFHLDEVEARDQAEVKVVLSRLYTCERDGRIVCSDAEGTTLQVVAHGEPPVLMDARTIIVSGSLDIRLTGGAGGFTALDAYVEKDAFGGSAAVTLKEGTLLAQEVSLGGLDMKVEPGDLEDTLKVSLSKASHVGNFVVISLDEEVLGSCDVDARGWDVTDGARAELELRRARDLADALDSEYEGDHAKFYTVEDQHGCQVILTNGHFSEKEFLLTGSVAQESGGRAVPAAPFLALALAVAGAAALVRSRRDA